MIKFEKGQMVTVDLFGLGNGKIIEIYGDKAVIKFNKRPNIDINSGVNPWTVDIKHLKLMELKKYAEDTLGAYRTESPGPTGPQGIGDLGDEDHDIDWDIPICFKVIQNNPGEFEVIRENTPDVMSFRIEQNKSGEYEIIWTK